MICVTVFTDEIVTSYNTSLLLSHVMNQILEFCRAVNILEVITVESKNWLQTKIKQGIIPIHNCRLSKLKSQKCATLHNTRGIKADFHVRSHNGVQQQYSCSVTGFTPSFLFCLALLEESIFKISLFLQLLFFFMTVVSRPAFAHLD